jgi:formylglycine-generating enzyme required for sulfatase activity
MKLPVWAKVPAGFEARLPSEAEWEYACRARSDTDYYNGDGEAALAEVGLYCGNSARETHPVDEAVGGQVEAHPFGLFGIHGNVWEWCRDDYRSDAFRLRVDGDPAVEESLRADEEHDSQQRVIRGGAWFDPPRGCRSACRFRRVPDFRGRNQGIRLCLAPGPAAAKTDTDKAEAEPGAGDAGRGTRPESDAPGAAGAGGTDLSTAFLPLVPPK